jgi:hypothetical protein
MMEFEADCMMAIGLLIAVGGDSHQRRDRNVTSRR